MRPIKHNKIQLMVVDKAGHHSDIEPLLKHALIELKGILKADSAQRQLSRIKPDVILMNMDHLNDYMGLLVHINQYHPVPVILLSHFSEHDTSFTAQALKLGATDFLEKPKQNNALAQIKDELLKKILMAGQFTHYAQNVKARKTKKTSFNLEKNRLEQTEAKLLLIGASTGGPKALETVLSALPSLPIPTVIIQHMPEGAHTQALARRLNQLCIMPVKEAENKELLKAGKVYLAPGDYHLELLQNQRVYLNQKPPQCSVRPSIDVTLQSSIRPLDGKVLSVILTGMGQDGLEGVKALKKADGRCISEAQSSCVVYGMPRMIEEHDLADSVVPLHQIARQIIYQLKHWH